MFSLNHHWIQSTKITLDIIGLLSQQYYFPWDGGDIKIHFGEQRMSVERKYQHEQFTECIASALFKIQSLVTEIQPLLDLC